MRKFGIMVFDVKGRLLLSQDLHGFADFQLTLGHLNRTLPDWDHFTITKKGFVEKYEHA